MSALLRFVRGWRSVFGCLSTSPVGLLFRVVLNLLHDRLRLTQMGRRWLKSSWRFVLLVSCTAIAIAVGVPAIAQSPPSTAAQLVERGLVEYRQGDYIEAIALWQNALQQASNAQRQAVIHSNLASAYQRLGQPQEAVGHWQHVLERYQQAPEADVLAIASVLTEQAQAYDAMGQHSRAVRLLENAIAQLSPAGGEPSRTILAAAYGALGNAYWALGRYEKAIDVHQISLDLAQKLNRRETVLTALTNLGNTYSSRARRYRYQAEVAADEGELDDARRLNIHFQRDREILFTLIERSLELAPQIGGAAEVRTLVNADIVLRQFAEDAETSLDTLRQRLETSISALPDSRDKVFALIHLARPQSDRFHPQATSWLEAAIAISRRINDPRAESFALGTLGEFYESNQQYEIALTLTQQAEFAAQQVNAFDSLYRWQWQAGRIHTATGRRERSLQSYRAATDTLAAIRSDILATSKDLQFDFRDAVEPVYRQLISLLLEPETPGDKQAKLGEVLDVLEGLKLAELQNFFGDECVEVAQSIVSENGQLVDANAVAVYTIVFDDRTAVLLKQADGTLSDYVVPIESKQLHDEVDRFRSLLEKRGTNEYLVEAQKLYDWLVRPLEADLAAIDPKTVVFIQDGVLRKTPVSALYDGQQFLIEKYALATTPSLALTTTSDLEPGHGNALIVGLTVEVPPFAPLNNVELEVSKVKEIVGGETLLDEEFTVSNFEQNLTEDSYAIVHMATHGKFGIDADSTFLLAYDDRITIEEVDRLLRTRRVSRNGRQPLELLVLSACQTAAGDNRSALGIAGVAVRAGAKSALATLWFINDATTVSLVEDFYEQLQEPGITKAEALRQAQLNAIQDASTRHPGVWSPFILIGSWE